MAIDFGFCMPTDDVAVDQATYVREVDRALELVSGRFDAAWAVDHLQFTEQRVLEAVTTLTFFAGRHPSLRFGHSVLSTAFRNPALVAKMAASLQFLTGGRFILGLGAGCVDEEESAYGYEVVPPHVRVARFGEALDIVRAMWTQPVVTFAGEHHVVREARCEPKPDPLPPIVVGAFRPRMLELTARHADWWNASSSGPRKYREMSEALDRACDRVGRDPASVRRTWCGGCACAPTTRQASRLAGDRFGASEEDDYGFVGTPTEIVEQMSAFVALGVDYFIVDCSGFPDLTTLELVAEEVLPKLNGDSR